MSASSLESAESLIASAGVPPDFLKNLLKESDWSFVIKLHALFEALVAGVVVKKLGKEALADVVAHLEFSDSKAGKVAFARALKLIGKNDATFLRALSELRNRLVHDVRNVNFNLAEYIASLDKQQKESFRRSFGQALQGRQTGDSEYARLTTESPSLILYFAAYSCILSIEFNLSDARIKALVEILRSKSPQHVTPK
jgi:hypothetical protein